MSPTARPKAVTTMTKETKATGKLEAKYAFSRPNLAQPRLCPDGAGRVLWGLLDSGLAAVFGGVFTDSVSG